MRSLEQQKIRKDEAARFMRAYAGEYGFQGRSSKDLNKDEMFVNFVFTYVETVRPNIMPGTPEPFVEAMDEASEGAQFHYEAIIKHFVRTKKLHKELKQNVHDGFFSHCAFLTEWDYHEELEFDENDEPVFEVDEDGEPVVGDDGEPVQAFKVVRDEPIAKRVDPWDVVLDPDSKSRTEDRWRALRLIMTKQEFDRLPGVTKEMKKQVRGKTLPRELVRQPVGESNNASTERNWVVLWRIYDVENNMIYLLPDGENIDFFVEEKEWPYEFAVGDDRFPVTVLEAKQDPENPYSFSPFKAFWPQVEERNKLRTMFQSNVRRNAPGWIAKKGTMDEEQKQKFVNMKIGEMVETNGDPNNVVTRPMPELPQGFFAWDKTVGDDLNMVSSLNEFAAGGALADTATEASILDAKSNIRKREAKDEFYDYCAVIFSKIGQLAQQFLTVPVAIKIKNPSNPDELNWLMADNGHIQGEFHLAVKPGGEEKENENLYRQQTLKGAEILAANPWVNQKKLAVKLARVFNWEADDILKTQEEYDRDQTAAAQAEAAKSAPKEQKPPLTFSPIKPETLPPEIQGMVVHAAMKQNNVSEGGGAIPSGLADPAALPSMTAAPPEEMVMPGAEINQTVPVNASAAMPPMNPVNPASEFQGG